MSCRWLTIFMIVVTMSLSMAQSPTVSSSGSNQDVILNGGWNSIQIGGCGGDLLDMTRTILDILENQDPCCPQSTQNISDVGHPRDCAELQASGTNTSGVYPIYPRGGDPFFVWCDMETDGGGWTVFQRRQDGSVDFQLDWADFKYGFGSVSAEHWLGNENIHRISTQKENELRVDLEDFDGQTRYAFYGRFSVANEEANYYIVLNGYSGDAGNSLSHHNLKQFTTRDRDNDERPETNCAVQFSGAWWHGNCHDSNLNGLYLHGETTEYATGVVWEDWLGDYYSLKKTEMKMRPV